MSGLAYDIIRRLAPSLAPYVGGTIIDICPGASLFSSKLHDYLKPREHILVEPDHKLYWPFLQPLLEAPNSSYSLRDWSEHELLYTPSEYLKEGLIPEKSSSQNNSVLQLVNAAEQATPTRGGRDSLQSSDLVAYRFMHDARLQSSFHARGPTRMLMWALDHQTAGLLPHTIDQRRKHAVGLEAHCHVDQVVGFNTAAQRVSQREQRLDIASSQRARQRMKEQKVFTPPTREDTTIEDSKGHAEVNRSWHEEYRDLVARFAAGQLSRFVGDSPAPWTDLSSRKSRKEVKAFTPEFERLKYFKRIMQGQSNLITKARSFVEKQAEIDALDLERYDPSITPTQMQNLVSEIKKRCASLNDGLCKAPVKIRNVFYLRSDDYYAFYMPTGPLMMWDRRNYEPLKASPDEFHLPREVTLLDFQAKPPDTLPLTENQSMYWDMITSCLYSPRGFHNLKYLDSIAPGAYESLVPKIGEFRDAREGGRYDVDMLRVRLLTPKMLWRLALEWDHWLFKPDIYEMAGSFETHVDTERKVASRYIMPV